MLLAHKERANSLAGAFPSHYPAEAISDPPAGAICDAECTSEMSPEQHVQPYDMRRDRKVVHCNVYHAWSGVLWTRSRYRPMLFGTAGALPCMQYSGDGTHRWRRCASDASDPPFPDIAIARIARIKICQYFYFLLHDPGRRRCPHTRPLSCPRSALRLQRRCASRLKLITSGYTTCFPVPGSSWRTANPRSGCFPYPASRQLPTR